MSEVNISLKEMKRKRETKLAKETKRYTKFKVSKKLIVAVSMLLAFDSSFVDTIGNLLKGTVAM